MISFDGVQSPSPSLVCSWSGESDLVDCLRRELMMKGSSRVVYMSPVRSFSFGRWTKSRVNFDLRNGGCQTPRTGTGRWFGASCWIWRSSLGESRSEDFGGGRAMLKLAWILMRGDEELDILLVHLFICFCVHCLFVHGAVHTGRRWRSRFQR